MLLYKKLLLMTFGTTLVSTPPEHIYTDLIFQDISSWFSLKKLEDFLVRMMRV